MSDDFKKDLLININISDLAFITLEGAWSKIGHATRLIKISDIIEVQVLKKEDAIKKM